LKEQHHAGSQLGPLFCWAVVFADVGTSIYYVPGILFGLLLLLGLLNWFGVSESAKVSLIGASIAFLSDIALLVTVFLHLSFTQFLALFPLMFAHHKLTLPTLLVGFAGSFLAFSGLESISQLSPYDDDQQARKTFGEAEHLAQRAKIARRFVYRLQEPKVVERIWRVVHPREIVVSPENIALLENINPDRIRFEVTPEGSVAHFLKRW